MWMTDPAKMCRKHLLGEHVEMHMFVGAMNCGRYGTFEGYHKNKLIDTHRIWQRHEDIVKEMKSRGYKHKTPLDADDWRLHPQGGEVDCIDVKDNEEELHLRCKECKF